MLLSRRKLPLNALRAFEAAARHCHMRRAAEELGVTHAAVSRQVRLLEESLGVSLFQRAHNRLQLTSAGQRLFAVMSDALDRITEGALYLDPDSMSGSLTVASTPSISASWLVTVMGDFSRKYPEIELHLVNIQPGERNLHAELDVAVCYGAPDERHLAIHELYRERFTPVCSPALFRDGQPINKPGDLLAYPLLHDQHGAWARWLRAEGLGEATAAQNFFLQDAFQVISALREAYGIALVDRIEVARDLRAGNLVSLFDTTVAARESVYLVTEPEGRLKLRTQVFVEHLQRALEDLGASLDTPGQS